MLALTKNKNIIIILIMIIIITAVVLSITLGNSPGSSTSAGNQSVGNFNISYFNNNGGGTDIKNYSSSLEEAINRIEEVLNLPQKINISVYSFQDNSSVLASASMADRGNIYSGGRIMVNTFHNAPNAGWDDVFIHEIFHLMGFGSHDRWPLGGTLTSSNFPNAFEQYNSYGGTSDFIQTSGTGHFDEALFGTEIMTPQIGNEVKLLISRITLGVLKDLGFSVNYNKADDYSLPT